MRLKLCFQEDSNSPKIFNLFCLAGGKEIRSYALDLESGVILYECSMNECSNWTENAFLHNDMIIIRRETQKVRAIELPSRIERYMIVPMYIFPLGLHRFSIVLILIYCRWNYSVGLHNVTITHNGPPECNSNHEKSDEFYIRAVVPKGLLLVSHKSNPDHTVWQYEVY